MIIVTPSALPIVIRLECYANEYAYNANLDEPTKDSRTSHSRSAVGDDYLEWMLPVKSAFYTLNAQATRIPPLPPIDNDVVEFSMMALQDGNPAPIWKGRPHIETRRAISVQDGALYVVKFDIDIYKVGGGAQ